LGEFEAAIGIDVCEPLPWDIPPVTVDHLQADANASGRDDPTIDSGLRLGMRDTVASAWTYEEVDLFQSEPQGVRRRGAPRTRRSNCPLD